MKKARLQTADGLRNRCKQIGDSSKQSLDNDIVFWDEV